MDRLWAPWRLEYVQSADEQDGCVFCLAAEGDDEDDEHDLSSVIIEEDEAELEAEARAMGKVLRKRTKKKASNKLFHSWDPISFPPLPDRGEFDVRTTRQRWQ